MCDWCVTLAVLGIVLSAVTDHTGRVTESVAASAGSELQGLANAQRLIAPAGILLLRLPLRVVLPQVRAPAADSGALA